MATQNATTTPLQQPTILSYVKDLPNLLSLSGLACTLLAIYFSISGLYGAAMIGMIWAVAFDWADGLVARKLKGRTANDAKFGGQLDVSIDIVSYGVTPAILLLSYGNFAPTYLFGVFIMVAAAALRLSYFTTYGLAGGTKYRGLALDNNSLILVFIFLFEGFFTQETFSLILYASGVILAILNVSEIATPKLSGNVRNVYLLGAYTLGITAIYGLQLMSN
ncbi:CDP-alcohol phosphatidyltransferase family protein [Sulfurimonas sp.]